MSLRTIAAAVVLAGAMLAGAAAPALACTMPHYPASHHVTVPDNGTPPLCPRADAGQVFYVHLRGTHVNFRARCEYAGRGRYALNELS